LFSQQLAKLLMPLATDQFNPASAPVQCTGSLLICCHNMSQL